MAETWEKYLIVNSFLSGLPTKKVYFYFLRKAIMAHAPFFIRSTSVVIVMSPYSVVVGKIYI
jgi:hypothetical protein